MREFQYKMVIVVRNDLNLSAGKLAAQVAHAAVNAVLSCNKKIVRKWLEEGAKKVVLKVADYNALINLRRRATRQGLNNHLVIDSGLTEIPPNTATCLAIGPEKNEKIDKLTGSLPLF